MVQNNRPASLTRGQAATLIVTALPMAAAGVTGGIASYYNFRELVSGSGAISAVIAGEGATLVCALVMLSLTLMAQHVPAVVRLGLWVLPLVASGSGVALADDFKTRVVMAVAPLAMTVAGEGVTLVARRVVTYRTGVDLEAQRRAGLLVWHAGRAANGGRLARRMSKAAVWRLTKQFAASDGQMSVQVDDIQRYRISENLDSNLSGILAAPGAGVLTELAPSARKSLSAPVRPSEALPAPMPQPAPILNPEALTQASTPSPAGDDGMDFIRTVLEEAETKVEQSLTRSDLLTTADVARIKGHKNTSTVRSWVHRKKLKPVGQDGQGHNLFSPLDVANLD